MASTSREPEVHDQAYGVSKVKITILASEWGSNEGELSTVIRELAIQLAKSSSVEITFLVHHCSDEDKKEALRHNVRILKATPGAGYEELPEDLQIDVIVGHGLKFGCQAIGIRNFHKCKWVQVVLSDPEEPDMFESYPNPISTSEERHGLKVELSEIADFVVGVGPKLCEAFRSYLRRCERDKTVFELTPGLFEEFADVERVTEERKNRSVLVFGHGDAADFELKGFDIAARAVASLPDTHLLFFGAPDGKLEEVAQRFLDCDLPANRLKVKSYEKNRESLKRLFCEVDLVLMPSRTEGFGLAGLEALSAGLPVLVCQNSGFGEALIKVPFGSSFVINSKDPERWAAAIKKVWEKDRKSQLKETEALRSSYEEKYSWSKQSDALLSKMINLVRARLGVKIDIEAIKGPDVQETATGRGVKAHEPVSSVQGVLRKIAEKLSTEASVRSGREDLNDFLQYLEQARKVRVVDIKDGSLIITVDIRSLEILEELWKDYRQGHLSEMAQKSLVSEDFLKEFGLSEVRLTTTIAEEEYRACRDFFERPGRESQLDESGLRSSERKETVFLVMGAMHRIGERMESERERSGLRFSFRRVNMDFLLLRMRHLLSNMESQLEESLRSFYRKSMDFLLHSMMDLLSRTESRLKESGLRSSYREEMDYLDRMMDLRSRILKADEKRDEEEADDGNGRNVGEEVTESGEQMSQQLHEVQTEKQQHLVEEEANKIRVYEGTVTSEGTHLNLKLGAVHLTFPPHAVSEPTSIVVHKWKSSVCSPQLQEHEAIVSNVIEISTTNNEASQFNVGVKLFFSHCAPDLQGYELVIKRLIKKEINDWEEVEGTVDVRELSDLKDDYPNDVPDFSFPVVQADIAEWSIYTVICRLKPSPTYTISSSGGCFNHPDYPGVAVSVPKEAVSVESKFPLQLKVQEVPNDEFKDGNVYVGPILRISCTQGIEFLKPVTIQLPVTPRVEGGTIPDPSICRVRVLFLKSDGENKEWVEITDELENPARFDGTSVTFQVKRFSGYAYVIVPQTAEQVADSSLHSFHCMTRIPPILASFFAYFRPSERIRSQDLLHLVCCPAHLRSQVKQELVRDGVSLLKLYEVSSGRGMIPGHDKAFVFVSGGIRPANEEYMGEVYLLLDASCQHRNQLPIRLISDQEYCLVEFRSFANLHFRLPSRQVQIETSSGFRVKPGSPTDEDLQAVAGEIGGKWKTLGRQLKIQESQLTGFDRDKPDEYEKAYAVLREWKQRGGSENANYRILKEALCHALVGRRDLAEEFCCLNNFIS